MVALSDVPVLAAKAELGYFNVQTATADAPMTAIEAWNRMQESPSAWLALAFRMRDAISTRFGVKRIGGFSGAVQSDTVRAGDYVDFFLVEEARPDLLVLTERDRHLDVMTSLSVDGYAVSVTSSVVTKSLFGRLCMIPVGLAHPVIVRSMMRRLK